MREALRRLAQAGAPQAVLERAPAELAAATGLERVLVSRVRAERIERARALGSAARSRSRAFP